MNNFKIDYQCDLILSLCIFSPLSFHLCKKQYFAQKILNVILRTVTDFNGKPLSQYIHNIHILCKNTIPILIIDILIK